MKEYSEFFIPVVIGVLFGEVLFQTNRHYVMKWRNTVNGYLTCLEHSVIFTLFIIVFLYLFNNISFLNLEFISCILVAHFIIDKFSIPLLWMRYLKLENSPILGYYQRKLFDKYNGEVNAMVFNNYIKDNPIIEVDEDLLNSNSFYISELYFIGIVIHIVAMFFLTAICKYQGII